jgi:phage/plasmid-associated DNA primase
MMILECANKVQNPDPNILEKMKAERPGILKRMMKALEDIYARGHFDMPESSKRLLEEYMKENNPVAMWFEETLEDAETDDECTPSGELYENFKDWCQTNGYRHPYTKIYWG